MTYRKKPVEVEAFRLGYDPMPDWFMNGITMNNVIMMFKNNYEPESPFEDCSGLIEADIKTLEGTMRADNGDYIIQGVKGEIYPCKPDIFEATYEKAIKDKQMREIKFKAWIFAAEYRFGTKIYIGQEKDVINIDFKNQKLSVLSDDGNAQEYALYDDNVYVAQYTGYKDGNGVEIYTGHVVTYFYEGLRCLGKILLHEGKFAIAPTWFEGNDTNSDRSVILGLHEILTQKSSYLEVANHICAMVDRKISDK